MVSDDGNNRNKQWIDEVCTDRVVELTGGCVFFFFKQKTAYEIVSRDWSSDVCSSDLIAD